MRAALIAVLMVLATPAMAQSLGPSAGPLNTANVVNYQRSATGSPVAVQSGKSILFFTNTSVATTQTVALPPNPLDGQTCRIAAAGAITILTVTDSSNVQVAAGLSLTAFQPGMLFLFTVADGWIRIA